MKLRKIVSGTGEAASVVHLSRCTAILSTVGFTRQQCNSRKNGRSTRSWEPENSISVLEYLERRGVIAGGQEKT